MSVIVGALLVVVGVLTFHPARPLYMSSKDIRIASEDGTLLRGTLSRPRLAKGDVPAVVIVHGSGRLSREHVRGDVRRLVRAGLAVLAYDKRGAGESGGAFPTAWGAAADSVLRVLAADAAAAFDSLRVQRGVDSARVGYFGASQASWIIPLAAKRSAAPPGFQVILSGAAVSTGEEALFSTLTGDGLRAPQVSGIGEAVQRTRVFDGDPGFDPRTLLGATRVPTLWLLGEEDQSVPTTRSVEVLDSIGRGGNPSHTVIAYSRTGHDLRNIDDRRPAPVWEDMLAWLKRIEVIH